MSIVHDQFPDVYYIYIKSFDDLSLYYTKAHEKEFSYIRASVLTHQESFGLWHVWRSLAAVRTMPTFSAWSWGFWVRILGPMLHIPGLFLFAGPFVIACPFLGTPCITLHPVTFTGRVCCRVWTPTMWCCSLVWTAWSIFSNQHWPLIFSLWLCIILRYLPLCPFYKMYKFLHEMLRSKMFGRRKWPLSGPKKISIFFFHIKL